MLPSTTCQRFLIAHTALSLLIIASPLVHAIDFEMGNFNVTTHGGVSYGTTIRTDSRDGGLITPGNGKVVGIGGSAVGGNNTDDGDLNFDKGNTVSSVVKTVLGADFKSGNYGFVVRAKAWQETSLGEANPDFGNSLNGYSSSQPLRDAGFTERAKFSGAVFQDAYVYGNFEPWDMPLNTRLGYQFLPWGSGWTIGGGISALNAVDLPAVRRAGALPEEMLIPMPALYSKLGVSENTSVEGFYQIRFRPTELDGCGTFFSTYDYVARGCNKVVVVPPTVSDPTALAIGSYGTRAATPDVSNNDELGIALTHKMVDIGTDFGAYLAEYHSRLPVSSAIKSTRLAPFPPFIPLSIPFPGSNPEYFTEYPERIRMLGLTFNSKRDDLTFAGELTYRPNQPVTFNATELLNAFVSNGLPTTLRADATATAPGGVFHGYDLRKVTQAQLSLSDKFPSILGAEEATLASEVGLKYMNDLPDQATRRYGRADAFGVGPVNGACSGDAIQCSQNGYVSRRAWGYRLKAGLRYPNVVDQIDLMPSIGFAHDVRGWSYDNGFNEGRHTLNMSLRATYQKMYYADFAWVPTWGGYYNSTRDKSYMTASAGLRF